jgi:hypothetical protein
LHAVSRVVYELDIFLGLDGLDAHTLAKRRYIGYNGIELRIGDRLAEHGRRNDVVGIERSAVGVFAFLDTFIDILDGSASDLLGLVQKLNGKNHRGGYQHGGDDADQHRYPTALKEPSYLFERKTVFLGFFLVNISLIHAFLLWSVFHIHLYYNTIVYRNQQNSSLFSHACAKATQIVDIRRSYTVYTMGG